VSPITIFVKSKGVMVSKEKLRKLSKDKLVDMMYDLLIKVDALTTEVQELRSVVKNLKTPKNSGNSSLPPSSSDLFRFINHSLRGKSDKKKVANPVTKEKRF